jgi:hypothetical protein
LPATIKRTKTETSRSALLILIVAAVSSRSSRYTPQKEMVSFVALAATFLIETIRALPTLP